MDFGEKLRKARKGSGLGLREMAALSGTGLTSLGEYERGESMPSSAKARRIADAYGVAGYVPRAPMMPIRFLSPSPSATLFDNWLAAQDQIGDLLYAAGVLTYPSVSLKFTLYRGTLLRTNTAPPARKILGFREYTVQWLPQGTIPAISGAPL